MHTILSRVLLLSLLPAALFAISYDYDGEGQLRQVNYSDGRSVQYAYDPAGNVLGYVQIIPADLDRDGLADAWEVSKFTSREIYSGEDDLDGDGIPLEIEFAYQLNEDGLDDLRSLPQAIGSYDDAQLSYRRAETPTALEFRYLFSADLETDTWIEGEQGVHWVETITVHGDGSETVLTQLTSPFPGDVFFVKVLPVRL